MLKIIIIEDEPQIRDEVMDWLRFEGYEALGAENGRVGLETIQKEIPDLIICDIAMPDMDGHEVLISVRSDVRFSHIPFVFLTADVEHSSVRRGMNMGADDYLTKPFTHAEVLGTIRSRLEKKISYERQTQSQLNALITALSEEREKNLLKSRLVAMFSHDFRNPLSSILSSSNIIRNYEARLTPERKHYHFNSIDGAVYRLVQMLEEMVVVAEIEGGHLDYIPQPVDLETFTNAMLEEFRLIDQNSHVLICENGIKQPIVADPKLLRHIMTNLITNALKYSPTGKDVQVNITPKGDTFTITVQDLGMGIPADDIAHLFDPFFRASNAKHLKGSGLGLSIVKSCVECHLGAITVTSEENIGTTFVVTLPLKIHKL
jgi:signal transduction histidine kinase